MKQIDFINQINGKKKVLKVLEVLAALCTVLCAGLLSGCSPAGDPDIRKKVSS